MNILNTNTNNYNNIVVVVVYANVYANIYGKKMLHNNSRESFLRGQSMVEIIAGI